MQEMLDFCGEHPITVDREIIFATGSMRHSR